MDFIIEAWHGLADLIKLEYAVSGLLVGILVGLTGVGGGSLMTPLLIWLFGFAPNTAVGTDLLFASITKAGGVVVHHGNHRSVEWKIVGLLACGSIPAALLVVWLLERLGTQSPQTTAMMTHALGVALILTALAMLFRQQLVKTSIETEAHHPGLISRHLTPITIAVGAVLGVLVTLSSVGAGVLGTVALFMLYPRLPAVNIVGTDLAHAIPLTAVAGLGHWHMGNVNFVLLMSLLVGSLPGIYAGSHLSAKIPDHYLRPILAGMLILIGIRFIVK